MNIIIIAVMMMMMFLLISMSWYFSSNAENEADLVHFKDFDNNLICLGTFAYCKDQVTSNRSNYLILSPSNNMSIAASTNFGYLTIIKHVHNGCTPVNPGNPGVICSNSEADDFTIRVFGFVNNSYTEISNFPGDETGWTLTIPSGIQYKVTEDEKRVGPYVFRDTYSPECRGVMQINVSLTCIVTNTFP